MVQTHWRVALDTPLFKKIIEAMGQKTKKIQEIKKISKSLLYKILNKKEKTHKKPPNIKGKENKDVSDLETENMKVTINLMLEKRKDVNMLLNTLEEAWREAAGPNIALNRPLNGMELPKQDRRRQRLVKISEKKRKLEEFQQRVFLSFQHLTDEKNAAQVKLGEKLMENFDTQPMSDLLASEVETFLDQEDRLNKSFLKKMHQLTMCLNPFLGEATMLKQYIMEEKPTDPILNRDIEVLEEFLKSTQKLLEK
jgi:hypothetical protein